MKTLLSEVPTHLKKLKVLDEKLNSKFQSMIKSFAPYFNSHMSDPEVEIIKKSLNNILENTYKFDTPEELELFKNDCWEIFNSIKIFSNAIVNSPNNECREIEKKLFKIAFIPGDGEDNFTTKILPVYRVHDAFLTTEAPITNFKSSTGSGKTRCAPFFFSIRALADKMKYPFFIMTQPSTSIIRDKIQDFKEILGDSVIYVTRYQEIEEYYLDFPDKPVVALFTPHTLIKIIARARDKHFQIVKYSRFVLDEIHERSVDTDVLVALLAEKMKRFPFPFQLLMMSATPDPRILEL